MNQSLSRLASRRGPRRMLRSLVLLGLLIGCGSTPGSGDAVNGGAPGAAGDGNSPGGSAGASAGAAPLAGTAGMPSGQAGSAGMELGGAPAAGSAGTSNPDATRVRTIIPLDTAWLFNKGDASGADQASFVDTAWRALDVPHDWSIEGPFDMNAATTGRGGYLPSGLGWYRKHFTLPQTLTGRRVFVEFDGVMANSDVYINGTHLGTHPYGYTAFRYELTDNVKFGSENVLSVKCDTSLQPASRYYTGSGILRHVRLIAADPVHIDQWATFVTTPTPSAASATVHVSTVVVNQGSAAQNVTVRGVVSDPSGMALAPIAAAAQSVAPGKVGTSFSFDVPVPNPKLWDLSSPTLYTLTTQVQVGGTTVDDDVTPFGIRSLVVDPSTGLSLNGKSLKLKGVAIHEEVSGLGSAVPQRAWQRRLAQLKALGANAVRTSHNPFSADFLELADRMGLLVLDEFFDSWIAHKYSDVGDFSAYFKNPAPSVTGSPAVPSAIAGSAPTWWQTEITNIVMHDRNHPSVVMYSTGNEIRDSIATRTPILTKMVQLCHQLDPSRSVTQALFDAGTAGDVTGATRTILDVWGNNYNVKDCTDAISATPKRAGVLTEVGHETTNWTTITNTPALIGEFIWTGADYLGEAPDGWPTVGSGQGLMDRMGQPKGDGQSYQKLWGVPVSSSGASGGSASKVVLSADHSTLLADVNDVVYIKAAISDSSGKVVTNSSAPVTFSLSGPGTIRAVDSASLTQESFRGSVRKASNGVCYAIIQATGPGAITVTASSAGLSGGSVMVQANAGTFVPCSGSCD